MRSVIYDHQIFGQQRFGGISRYFCELAARVAMTPDWSARVLAPVHFNDHLAESSAPKLGWHLRQRSPKSTRLYRAANMLLGPPLLKLLGGDIVHRTYYTDRPGTSQSGLVITVFDMIHELFPQSFPSDDPVSARKRRCVAAADRLICISHSTARDLVRLCNVPPEKVVVTHLGFSDAFACDSAGAARDGERPYLLYVGHRHGYKNFGRLLEAYAASPQLRSEFALMAFGGQPFGTGEKERISLLGLSGEQVYHRAGSDADLVQAYSGARLFVYPSEYEGFGIPPLEAMSCGCPVTCSNTSSMPEVVGMAAEYFSPTNVDSIRNALETVAFDDSRRRELIANGFRQRALFTWDRCAEETIAVYRQMLSRVA